MLNNKLEVASPLIYSSLFHFPLTIEEICLLSQKRGLTIAQGKKLLASCYPYIQGKDGFYFLKGEQRSVTKRIQGSNYAQQKYSHALKVITCWKYIPTVLFIGMSGSVATGSAKKTDDIDFFVVTKRNSLFITRCLMLLVLQILGMRKDATGARFCLNLFIDETSLAFPQASQDLYTARELYQLVPLMDVSNTYRKLMQKNAWTRAILPNAIPKKPLSTKQQDAVSRSIAIVLSVCFEDMSRILQESLFRKNAIHSTRRRGFLGLYSRTQNMRITTEYARKLREFEAELQVKPARVLRSTNHIDKEKNIFYTA